MSRYFSYAIQFEDGDYLREIGSRYLIGYQEYQRLVALDWLDRDDPPPKTTNPPREMQNEEQKPPARRTTQALENILLGLGFSREWTNVKGEKRSVCGVITNVERDEEDDATYFTVTYNEGSKNLVNSLHSSCNCIRVPKTQIRRRLPHGC